MPPRPLTTPPRIHILTLLHLALLAAAQTSTTLVSITRTTTVRATATDDENACVGFYGACVIYGLGDGADDTTTVYRSAPRTPSLIVTATTTVLATTTAADSGACNDYTGACVVYGSGHDGAASSTVYQPSGAPGDSDGHAGLGNGEGYIAAQGDDGGEGQLGGTAGAVALKRCTYEALVGLGLAVGVAALLV